MNYPSQIRSRSVVSSNSFNPDHRFSHSPSMAYPLAGCFVSAILLKLRHLCEFSVCGNFPAEKEEKTVSDASLADFPPFFSV